MRMPVHSQIKINTKSPRLLLHTKHSSMRTPSEHSWSDEMKAAYPTSPSALFRQSHPGAQLTDPDVRALWEQEESRLKLLATYHLFMRDCWTSPSRAGRKFVRTWLEHCFRHGERAGTTHCVRLCDAVFDVVCAKHAGSDTLARDVRSELFFAVEKHISKGKLHARKYGADCLAWFAAHRPSDDTVDFVYAMDADAHQAAQGWGPKGKGNAPSAN